jgi:hypothetical protein
VVVDDQHSFHGYSPVVGEAWLSWNLLREVVILFQKFADDGQHVGTVIDDEYRLSGVRGSGRSR